MDQISQAERRETLQFLMSCEMPAQHKRILIEALTQTMRNEDDAADATAAGAIAPAWQPSEIERLSEFLRPRVAQNWQHADEALTRIAAELRRTPVDVASKARELGFASSIDFAVARRATQSKSDE